MRGFNNLLGIVSLAFFIGGCSSEEGGEEPHIGGALKVMIAYEKPLPPSDSVLIQVKRSDGKIMHTYSSISQIPATGIPLDLGEYTIEGTPTNKRLPLFNRPSYGGSCNTNLNKSEANVTLTLKQANVAVQVNYSEKFKSEFTNYTTTISSPDGSLTYGSKEDRLGYFTSGPLEIKLTYTDKQGVVQNKIQKIDATSKQIAPGSTLALVFSHPDEENGGGNYEAYYLNALGKTGIELKKALTTIISTGYQAKSYNDLWSAYKIGDIRTDGTGAIWDVYSDIPLGKAPYLYQPGQDQCGSYSGEGSCYNREHTIPKSWFNDDTPMYSDYLHILPTDGYVNGRRSNYPYGEVGSASWTSRNGSKLGSAKSTLGYNGTVFEPIDDFKGDIARIYFYFVTRYADVLSKYDVNNGSTEEVFNSNDLGLDQWTINMFLRWSKNDPVSPKERVRNNEAQKFQNNRNPYVDHPEFIEKIWGSNASNTAAKSKMVKVYYKVK